MGLCGGGESEQISLCFKKKHLIFELEKRASKEERDQGGEGL